MSVGYSIVGISLDIIKMYLILSGILGMKKREFGKIYAGIPLCILFYAVVQQHTEKYGLFALVGFLTFAMCICFYGKLGRMLILTLWLCSIIGILDEVAQMVFRVYILGISNHLIIESFVCGGVTIFVILLVSVVLKWRTRGKKIKIAFKYVIFFSILGMLDSFLIAFLQVIVEEMAGKPIIAIEIILSAIAMYLQMGMVLVLAVSRDAYKERDALKQQYLAMQKENDEYLQMKERDTRKFRHDVGSHMLAIQTFCEREQYEELKHYVTQIQQSMHLTDERVHLKHPVVNAVVNHFLYYSQRRQVLLKIEGNLSEECPIEDFDLSVIFSNLLKNAIEAAQEGLEKRVECSILESETELLLSIQNDYLGERKKKNGKYVTSKADASHHGIGLENVQDCVDKYHGTMEMEEKQGIFCTILSIPIKE